MAIVETLTTIANTGAAAQYYAYSTAGVPSPIALAANKPECWYIHKCYEKITGTTPTNTVAVTGTSPNQIATITQSTGIANTLPLRVGDLIQFSNDLAVDRNQGVITRVNTVGAGAISVVVEQYGGFPFVATTNIQIWVSYQGRRSRLADPEINTAGPTAQYKPTVYGQLYVYLTDYYISTGAVSTAYYIDASRLCQSLFNGLPMANQRLAVNTVEASWKLTAGSAVVVGFGSVRNQTAFNVLMQSYQVNGQFYDVRFCVDGLTVYAGKPTGFTGTIEEPSLGPFIAAASGPVVYLPSNPSAKWLMWQSRFGTPQVWPFNYNNAESLEINLVGTARKGYDTNNVNMMGYDKLSVSTGMITNKFRDWLEDLAVSPYVYVADAVPIVNSQAPAQVGPTVDYSGADWVLYRITDGVITTKANANDLIALTFDLVKTAQRVTYNN
jgi:hypothetical protein